MSIFPNLLKVNDEQFHRKTGVRREEFNRMTEVLLVAEKSKKEQGGKPNRLSIEDRLLMWLEYKIEMRSYFHIGSAFGVSESTCFRNCNWVEEVLAGSGKFNLPA